MIVRHALHHRLLPHALSSLALVTALALGACGDDDDGGTKKTLTYSGSLVDGVTGDPIEGVQICFTNLTLDCVSTNAQGAYSISGLPAATKVEAEATKTGYISIATNFITRDADATISAQMFPPAAVELAFTAAGATYDDSKGGLLVRVYDPAVGQTQGLAGVAIDTSPSDADGPYYIDGLTFSADATATSAIGQALFTAMETRSYAVTFESATHTCPGTYLWKDSAGRIEAKVKAGFATYLYVDCVAK